MHSEPVLPSTDDVAQPHSPGQLLRAAREAKGVHLAMLSVALKVPVRQLEALEKDDATAFRGATFMRALAQAVCRHLGADPVPVLAGLPQQSHALGAGLSPSEAQRPLATARSGEGFRAPSPSIRRILMLALLGLVVTLVAVWLSSRTTASAPPAPVQDAPAPMVLPTEADSLPASAPVLPASSETTPPLQAPAPNQAQPVTGAISPVVPTTPTSAGPALQFRASQDTWVTVRDDQGQQLVKRLLKAGETLQHDAQPPLFVYVGRADSTELIWQGQVLDLRPHTQNNEARLRIKP